MTIANTPRTTANAVTEGSKVTPVDKVLWHLGEPADSPINTLLGGTRFSKDGKGTEEVPGAITKEVAEGVDYKIVEKDPLARAITVNGAIASTSTATIVVDDSSMATVGDLIRNKTTGEVMIIKSITDATTIVVGRNLGSTTHQIADDAVLFIFSFADKQGGSKRGLRSQLASPRTRYLQIFKRTFGVTGTAQAVKLDVNVTTWDEEQTQAAINHKKDIEFAFWANPAADSTTNAAGDTVNLSRGILAEIGAAGTISCSGTLDDTKLFGTVSEQIFQYGPSRKTLFADAKLRSIINKMGRDKVQITSKVNDFGMTVKTIETGHGILDMVACGAFDQFSSEYTTGFGVALDLERVKYKHLNGRDSRLMSDTQTPGDDVLEASFLTEAGLSLYTIPHHKILTVA
jgi:hypothetical protein